MIDFSCGHQPFDDRWYLKIDVFVTHVVK